MRSIFARTYEDASIESSGFTNWLDSGVQNYEPGVTFQAEFETYGPGFNETGRIAAGYEMLLNQSTYEPYDEPAKVFQYGYTDGRFGNVAWIDRTPWA